MDRPIPKSIGYISRSIYKGKTKYYIQKFPLRYLDDGQLEYYSGSSFDTLSEAEDHRKQLIIDRDNKKFIYDNNFYDYCVDYVNKRDILEITKHRYLKAIEHNLKDFKTVPINNVTVDMIQNIVLNNCIDYIYLSKVLSPVLDKLWRTGVIKIDIWSLIDKPKRKRKIKQPLTLEQLRQYYKAIKGMPLEHVARIMFATGIRRGEALAIKWKDIFFDTESKGHINIYKSYSIAVKGSEIRKPKTELSNRTVYFNDKYLVDLLKAKMKGKNPNDYISIYRNNRIISIKLFSSAYFDDIGKMIGVKLSSHYARVTYTSYALEYGLLDTTIQQQLGHTTTNLIHSVYGKAVGNLKEKLSVNVYNIKSHDNLTNVVYHDFKRVKTN